MNRNWTKAAQDRLMIDRVIERRGSSLPRVERKPITQPVNFTEDRTRVIARAGRALAKLHPKPITLPSLHFMEDDDQC